MQCAFTITSPVTCPSLQYFSTLSHKRHDFPEKFIEHKMCILILATNLCDIFLILRRTDRNMIKNMYWSLCKGPVILGRFEWNLNYLYRFLKNTQILHFTKSVQWEPSCFMRQDGRTDRRTDGQADMMKLIWCYSDRAS